MNCYVKANILYVNKVRVINVNKKIKIQSMADGF